MEFPYQHQIEYFQRDNTFSPEDQILIDKLHYSTTEAKTLNLIQAETQVRQSKSLESLNNQLRNSFIQNYLNSLFSFSNSHFTTQTPAFMIINKDIQNLFNLVNYLLEKEILRTLNIKHHILTAITTFSAETFDLSFPVPFYELMRLAPIFTSLREQIFASILPNRTKKSVISDILRQATQTVLGEKLFNPKSEFSTVRYFAFGVHESIPGNVFPYLKITDSERNRLYFLRDFIAVVGGLSGELGKFYYSKNGYLRILAFKMSQILLKISTQTTISVEFGEINEIFNSLFPVNYSQKHAVRMLDLMCKVDESLSQKALILIKNEFEQVVDDFKGGIEAVNMLSYI